MPFKIGLAQKRKRLLEAEIERIIAKISELDVEKIILVGSLTTDTINKASDIDLIVIKKSNGRFLDRLEKVYQHLKPKIGVDILVYTPQEFEVLSKSSPFIISALKNGKIIYER